MVKKETFDRQMQLRISDEFVAAVEGWMTARDFDWSRSEAIRYLVAMGIDGSSHETYAKAFSSIKSAVKMIAEKTDNGDVQPEFARGLLLKLLLELGKTEDTLNREVVDVLARIAAIRAERTKALELIQNLNTGDDFHLESED